MKHTTLKSIILVTLTLCQFYSVTSLKTKFKSKQVKTCFNPGKNMDFKNFFPDNKLGTDAGSSIEFSVTGKDFYVGVYPKAESNRGFLFKIVYGGFNNQKVVGYKTGDIVICEKAGVKVKNEKASTNYKFVFSKATKSFQAYDSGVLTFTCDLKNHWKDGAQKWAFASWDGTPKICPSTAVSTPAPAPAQAAQGSVANSGSSDKKCTPKGLAKPKL